ncbi:hypothetical protein SAMN04489725_1167 [Alicyclobacillus hesperidum]|uniref:Uncharacterized protein n=1 Tax=Alicyclobacillus hesperidum TaxID=89784 RepID=A0A1H2WNC8_9BACL|nr:hypothetical protein SAMN04489725_1167 [Alicyclobacillus hesperidum]
MGSGETLGATVDLPSGSFYVQYSISLGDVIICSLLALILIVIILRWIYDVVF